MKNPLPLYFAHWTGGHQPESNHWTGGQRQPYDPETCSNQRYGGAIIAPINQEGPLVFLLQASAFVISKHNCSRNSPPPNCMHRTFLRCKKDKQLHTRPIPQKFPRVRMIHLRRFFSFSESWHPWPVPELSSRDVVGARSEVGASDRTAHELATLRRGVRVVLLVRRRGEQI